jgi:hypothetical protein
MLLETTEAVATYTFMRDDTRFFPDQSKRQQRRYHFFTHGKLYLQQKLM